MSLAKEVLEKGMKEVNEGELKRRPSTSLFANIFLFLVKRHLNETMTI